MSVFVSTIFLSAFLLFQVQPIIARYILPWYGGSPAVWTTCMLCFQVGLLAGYAYAHGLVARWHDHPRRQAGVHLALVVLSLFLLPITPSDALKPDAAVNPSWGIITLLLRTVGLPFLVISASGPLLQHWFASANRGVSPYRLYAVSNLGSLLALVSYPFLFEPLFGLRLQTHLWSGAFVVYGILAALCARKLLASSQAEEVAPADLPADSRPPVTHAIFWGACAALGSVLLLSITNKMSQDIAVVPFLWVLPLALYLLTFIICFDHDRWYRRDVWFPATILLVGALIYLINQDFYGVEHHVVVQISIYAAAMFTCCMVCHGEMVRLKPAPRYLTSFYLAIALGGAIGGLLVSQVAPRIFPGYWELHAGLAGVAALITWSLARTFRRRGRPGLFWQGAVAVVWIQVLAAMGYYLYRHIDDEMGGALLSERGFYGVLRVYEGDVDTDYHWRALYHGRINHGQQYFSTGTERSEPSTYYMPESGPGRLFEYHPKRAGGRNLPMKVGVVGLGIGTLAAYGEEGDAFRFYEINPDVESIARTQFSYLGDCAADVTVVLGDARISMERELAEGDPQEFDVLILDAFSSDSIPLHLFTRESFELYLEHLDPLGVLLVHITNLHLDLSDPVRTLADDLGLHSVWIERDAIDSGEYYSSWVLLSRFPDFLDRLAAEGLTSTWPTESPRPIRWTDDYSNLFDVIIWE